MSSTIALPQTDAAACHHCVAFETDLNWMALKFDTDALHQVAFGYPNRERLLRSNRFVETDWIDEVPDWVADLRDRLINFAAGEPQEFGDIRLATDHLTPFGARVIKQCQKLGWGQVRTYAQLAKLAGRPGAARAVGNVMANNRFPIVVPCHRVVGSGGGLGGYSAPGGLTTKQRLLHAEGSL